MNCNPSQRETQRRVALHPPSSTLRLGMVAKLRHEELACQRSFAHGGFFRNVNDPPTSIEHRDAGLLLSKYRHV